jgi:hypothetical protein
MQNGPLGILERIELRDIWLSEAVDFTPWLAGAENLAQLGQTIGMELELEAQEKNVGPFRADILCKDTATGNWVLIENQLERTDHVHLGQLLTYAAGLKAVTIVWVAAQFTEEHRATLDWLNNITDDGFQFFGLEVELWRIGDSPAAPKFNIASKPNDWTRSVNVAARRIENESLTDTKAKQLEYWTEFSDFLKFEGSPIRPQKPYPQHWMNFSIGRTGFLLSALLNSTEGRIGVDLYLSDDDAKAYFGLLSQQKERIEEELGFSLNWMELPDRKACRLLLFLENVDPLDHARWPEYRKWMKEHLEQLNTVFRPLVRTLNAADWQPEEER